jgi:S1-C subfamily serine protease
MRKKSRFGLGLTAFLLVLAFGLKAEPKSMGLDENTIENVAKKVFASVVKVEARNGIKKVATGVVIDKEGYIVTTALISPRDEEIIVTTSDGRRSEAKFLGMDPETYLALIQTKEKNLTPINLGKAEDLDPGSWVGVISISPENTPSVTQGIVSSIALDRLRLNVWVTRGGSGSPVVNKEGQMVGLLRGIYTEDQPVVFEFREREVVGSGYAFSRAEAPSSGMALAIPVSMVKSITTEIKEKGKVSRGWMGVSVSENEKGQVEINDVEADSPAELAKLKEGDIILKLEGKDIASASMFASEIRNKKPGQDVNLLVGREGKSVEVKVRLGEYPEGEAQREMELRFPRLFPPQRPMETPEPLRIKPERPPALPKLEELRKAWPQWEKRKYIGVYLGEINKELLEYFGVKGENGLLVNRLAQGGPAEKAGLKVGDVIVRVDGKNVGTVAGLSELIQDKKKGDKIKIDLVRDKKPISIEVEIEEEEGPSSSYFFDSIPSRKGWGDFARELQGQAEKSLGVYEIYSVGAKDKMKKLNDEINKQTQEFVEKSKEAARKWKGILGKNRIFYRV